MIEKVLFLGISSIIQVAFYKGIKKLNVYQQIYELSPKEHQKKGKTPSIGGLGMWVSMCIGVVMCTDFQKETIWVLSLLTGFMAIGLVDDIQS